MNEEAPQERRKEDRRFKTLEDRCSTIECKLDENTAATARVEKNTSEIVEAWKALSGGLKVLGWLGACAKWAASIALFVSALGGAWYAITHWGQPPDLPTPK